MSSLVGDRGQVAPISQTVLRAGLVHEHVALQAPQHVSAFDAQCQDEQGAEEAPIDGDEHIGFNGTQQAPRHGLLIVATGGKHDIHDGVGAAFRQVDSPHLREGTPTRACRYAACISR